MATQPPDLHPGAAQDGPREAAVGRCVGPMASLFNMEEDVDESAQQEAFELQKRGVKRKLENMKLLQTHTTKDDSRTFVRDRLFALNAVMSIVLLIMLFVYNWESCVRCHLHRTRSCMRTRRAWLAGRARAIAAP